MRIYFSGDNFFHLSLKLGPAPCGPAPAYPLLPIPSFFCSGQRRRQTLNGKTQKCESEGKKSIIEKFCLFYVFIMRSVCQIMIMARNISFIELSQAHVNFSPRF